MDKITEGSHQQSLQKNDLFVAKTTFGIHKNTFGALFRKTIQNALQRTTVRCNVMPQILTLNGSNMTHNDPG